MDTLLRLTKRWLQPDMHSATEVVERVAVDRFLRTLPPTERQAVGMRVPGTSRELLTALEHTLTTLALGKEGQHQQGHPDYGAPQDKPSPTESDHRTEEDPENLDGRTRPPHAGSAKTATASEGSTSATGLPGPRRGGRRDRR
ncbi:zinc finger and SCAN domain-containing protein 22-like [Ictalurus punctatus]|uniref:Zinc finger and SCAN domain-containing protein 22-like n=1 Tax=Ictalurus punctatus TaxID=7998 RepID=A0A9F7RC76_ICTPU|nr:zinc finger and SCAN domain-containing protein 22-like [Ictalurus punctatus]